MTLYSKSIILHFPHEVILPLGAILPLGEAYGHKVVRVVAWSGTCYVVRPLFWRTQWRTLCRFVRDLAEAARG
jgi:hypothetical protein